MTLLTIATVNVNGIRAAARKGFEPWLESRQPDILCLQEVRAPDEIVSAQFGDDWHLLHSASVAKGRAGVAVVSRLPFEAVRLGVGDPQFDETGRWVEADVKLPGGKILTVVSAYVHSGEVDTQKQIDKYAFLDAMEARLGELAAHTPFALVAGDLNVAHRNVDIKNWKGNLKRAGFLPEERVYFDRFFDEHGWVDLGRRFGGEGPGPYTWWSNRGQAFDNDAGWRIDYQMTTPALAEAARTVTIDRAESYDARWSDHAPVVVEYEL